MEDAMTNAIIRPQPRSSQSFAAETFVATVAGRPHAVRGLQIWPIAEVLGYMDRADTVLAEAAAMGDPAAADDCPSVLLQDLLDSMMIAPPRLRRRRQRTASSRAVAYAAAHRQAGRIDG